MHGASTHFPIALTLVALLCDGAAVCLWHRPARRGLRSAGLAAAAIAAAGTVPAVASGLWLTRGDLLGAGALRWHHLFAWPAFGLIVAAATWRGLAHRQLSRRAQAAGVAAWAAAALLVSAAGYWGGQLLQAFP
ncbi:MAG TPA: DUF2231 domain-containing protein [Opitutaceae bacterium]|nr:DUF2231 domain-containing protein [Opitutaceae bacterium]